MVIIIITTNCYAKYQGYTNPGCQVFVANNFFTVARNISWSLVWNLRHVSLLAPRVLRYFLDFLKICAYLLNIIVAFAVCIIIFY